MTFALAILSRIPGKKFSAQLYHELPEDIMLKRIISQLNSWTTLWKIR